MSDPVKQTPSRRDFAFVEKVAANIAWLFVAKRDDLSGVAYFKYHNDVKITTDRVHRSLRIEGPPEIILQAFVEGFSIEYGGIGVCNLTLHTGVPLIDEGDEPTNNVVLIWSA